MTGVGRRGGPLQRALPGHRAGGAGAGRTAPALAFGAALPHQPGRLVGHRAIAVVDKRRRRRRGRDGRVADLRHRCHRDPGGQRPCHDAGNPVPDRHPRRFTGQSMVSLGRSGVAADAACGNAIGRQYSACMDASRRRFGDRLPRTRSCERRVSVSVARSEERFGNWTRDKHASRDQLRPDVFGHVRSRCRGAADCHA